MVVFQKSADIINKVLTKQKIFKKDLDDFLMVGIIPPHKPILDEKNKKLIKQHAITMLAEFLADYSDKDTLNFFERYCEERKLESYTSLTHVILRIYTRLFKESYEEDKISESKKLLPKILELVQTIQDQINGQEYQTPTKRRALAEALSRIGDYHLKLQKPQLGIKSYLEAMIAYTDDAWRFFEPALLNIRVLKKEQVMNYWLTKLIQISSLPQEVKPDLLSWLTKSKTIVRSQDPKILCEYEEEKRFLQNRIRSKELDIIIDKLVMYDQALFYAYNNQVDEFCKIFELLEGNGHINRIFKNHIKLECLRHLSEGGDTRIATMIDQIDEEIVAGNTQYSMLKASAYLNLFDSLKERIYLEKGSSHLLKINKLFVDYHYYRECLINLNLAFATKILLVSRESDLNQEDFESASNFVCIANELFLTGRDLDYLKETLLNMNGYMSCIALQQEVSREKHVEFIDSCGIEMNLIKPVNDFQILHEQYQEIKSRAGILQDLGEPDVVYSWKFRDQVYRSNDPNVFLIDPLQLIYAINDLKGSEEELKHFDIALQKGLVGSKGCGIKYIKERHKEILEAKTPGDKRSVSDIGLFNQEGAKIFIFSHKLTQVLSHLLKVRKNSVIIL